MDLRADDKFVSGMASAYSSIPQALAVYQALKDAVGTGEQPHRPFKAELTYKGPFAVDVSAASPSLFLADRSCAACRTIRMPQMIQVR